MTRSATEQPDVAMGSSLAAPAGPPGQIGSTGPTLAMNLGTLPLVTHMEWEIHVDFNNGMWRAMPRDLSDALLDQWVNGAQQVSFVWDWQDSRMGSYTTPESKTTTYNRYVIDFTTMYQQNLDHKRTREVRIAYVVRWPVTFNNIAARS